MKHLFLFQFIFISVLCFAQSNLMFTENNGQWHPNVLYKADLNGGAVYLERDNLHFIFYDTEAFQRVVGHNHGHSSEKDTCSHKIAENHHEHSDSDDKKVDAHSYRLSFIGANLSFGLRGLDKYSGQENYYIGNDPSKWASGVHSFKAVVYQNIYPNIDLKVYSKHGSLKYDFIVYPGGNVDDIQCLYSGIDSISFDIKRGIVLKTKFAEIVEQNPVVFQNGEFIHSKYNFQGDRFSYSIEDYSSDDTLVIDPSLNFSAYSGSTVDNWGYTATYDLSGNAYSGGIVVDFGYRVTEGAFQYNFGGPGGENNSDGWDMGIIKYDAQGRQLYATYLGGGDTDIPHSMIVNSQNELIILGTTGSSDFPMHSSAYDNSFNGGNDFPPLGGINFDNGSDIVVAKLSADGSALTGSTFFGGSNNDGFNIESSGGSRVLWNNYGDEIRGEVMLDENDNVYVGSSTMSDDIPIVNGFMTNAPSGQNGIMLKLNPQLSDVVWSSYYGGSATDAIFSVHVNSDEELYFTGSTSSSDLIVSSGVYQVNYGGNHDGFIGKVSADGSQILAATYFGSGANDHSYLLKLDEDEEPVIYGQTQAPAGEFVYNVGYSNSSQNGGQFVTAFNSNLTQMKWSTRFGSNDGRYNISPTAFAVDICNRIYLAGFGLPTTMVSYNNYNYLNATWTWDEAHNSYRAHNLGGTWGDFGMEVTPDAYQSETDGQDFYLMVLGGEASDLQYATYYGQIGDVYATDPSNNNTYRNGCYRGYDHVDGGTSRFDAQGNIYQAVCASCGGCQGFPTGPNEDIDYVVNGSENCNNAIFSFKIGLGLIDADFSYPEQNCQNMFQHFQNQSYVNSQNDATYFWDFGDGATSTEQNPDHSYAAEGVYEVTLIVYDPTSCNEVDSITKSVEIEDNPDERILDTIHVCQGDSVQIGIEPKVATDISYSWTPDYNMSDNSIANPYVAPLRDTTYMLTFTEGGCIVTYDQPVDFHTVNLQIDSIVASPPRVCGDQPTEICVYANDEVEAYVWAFDPNFRNIVFSEAERSCFTFSPQADYTHLYLKALTQYCDIRVEDGIDIIKDSLGIQVPNDTTICFGSNSMIALRAENTTGVECEYDWTPKEFIISGDGTSNPIARPIVTTDFVLFSYTEDTACYELDTMTVEVDQVDVFGGSTDISCFGEVDGRIMISPPYYHYMWTDGDTSFYRNNLQAGEYFVTITSDHNCVRDTSYTISEPTRLFHEYKTTPVSCPEVCNGTIDVDVLGGSPPYLYNWNIAKTGDTLKGLCPGTYIVQILDDHECEIRDTVVVKLETKYPYLNLSAEPEKVYLGQSTTLAATDTTVDPTYTYYWMPELYLQDQSSAITQATPEEEITYQVFVEDTNGCMSKGKITIPVSEFVCDEPFIYVPNAFSPNGDGVNDFTGVFANVLSDVYFAVYDRWGEMVYETSTTGQLWDGMYKGKELPPGVFVYYLKATCVNGEEYIKKGNITLIR